MAEKPTQASVRVYTARDDIENTRRARLLVAALEREGWDAAVIDKLGSLPDLMKCVEDRVVHVPCVVVRTGGTVVARLLRVPSVKDARTLLDGATGGAGGAGGAGAD